MSKRVIRDIQENIAKATLQLNECKEMLDQLYQDLNRLTITGTTSSKEKKTTSTPRKKKNKLKPYNIGDSVISKTRPNRGVVRKITGRTEKFFIITSTDKTLKRFRKAWHNLTDLNPPDRNQD